MVRQPVVLLVVPALAVVVVLVDQQDSLFLSQVELVVQQLGQSQGWNLFQTDPRLDRTWRFLPLDPTRRLRRLHPANPSRQGPGRHHRLRLRHHPHRGSSDGRDDHDRHRLHLHHHHPVLRPSDGIQAVGLLDAVLCVHLWPHGRAQQHLSCCEVDLSLFLWSYP